MNFSIISALDQNRGIGKNNGLPWHLPADMKHFKESTLGGTVIMGRKTWDSIPEKYRPFKDRLNIVISRSELALPDGVLLAHSLDEALDLVETHGPERKAFVIGGATLYAEAIQHPNCEELNLTQVESSFDCDAFFPKIPESFKIHSSTEETSDEFTLSFQIWKKESQLDLFISEDYKVYLQFLRKLCEFPSVFSNPEDVEKAIAYCKNILEENLKDYKVYYDKAKNLIATPKKIDQKKDLIYLSAHIDTVGADPEEWTAPYHPWRIYEDEEQMVARGVNDCKAGVAYQLFLSHLHKNKNLTLKNLIFTISFKEEGAGEKTAEEIGLQMGKTLPLSEKNTYLFVLENNVQVEAPSALCIYASERSNYVIKITGFLSELQERFKKLHQWNPVSILPEAEVSFDGAKEIQQPGGHVCSITRSENRLTEVLLRAENTDLLKAGTEKNFATVPTQIQVGKSKKTLRHQLVLNNRSFESLEDVLLQLKGIDYVPLKNFGLSQGFNIEEKFQNSELKKALEGCEENAWIGLKYTYNVGGSDATHIYSTLSSEQKENFYPLVLGPGSRSQKKIDPPRATHGANETYDKKTGKAAIQFLSSCLKELGFISYT